MKKGNVISILALVIAIGVGIIVFVNRQNDLKNSTIIISRYEVGSAQAVKTVNITSRENVKKMDEFITQLNASATGGALDLSITNEKVLNKNIEVLYKDDITIVFELGQMEYCHYTNISKGISRSLYIPDGLYDWVTSKV